MGLKEMFSSGEKKGWDCRKNLDGTVSCDRFIADKNGKSNTATSVTIGADPKRGCEPFITGDSNSILDDEMADIDVIANKVTLACKRGM